MNDASIRYTIIQNIERAALSSAHADVLERLVRKYELELIVVPCLRKADLDKIASAFKKKQLQIIVPEIDKFTVAQTSNVNLTAILINVEKSVRVFTDMLKLLTDMLTTILTSFSRGLVGFNMLESKEVMRALAFVSIAKIYKPKGSIDSLLSWGESLNILKGIGSNKILLERSFEEATICAVWQQAIYLISAKRTVPLSTINVLFRRKGLLEICRDIETRTNNLSANCDLEGIRVIYEILNSFIGFASPIYKRMVKRFIAKQAKEYRKTYEDLLIYAIKNLL
jgi:hypothetical protein